MLWSPADIGEKEIPPMQILLDHSPDTFDPLVPEDLYWYQPVLGPSSCILVPNLIYAGGSDVALEDLAWLAGSLMPSVLLRTLNRLWHFRVIASVEGAEPTFKVQPHDQRAVDSLAITEATTSITIRRFLPPVPRHQVKRGPGWWQAAYQIEMERRGVTPTLAAQNGSPT